LHHGDRTAVVLYLPRESCNFIDVIDIYEYATQVDFCLDERNIMEKSDYKLGTISSYGFTAEHAIQYFLLLGKPVCMHVWHRKQRDSSIGEA